MNLDAKRFIAFIIITFTFIWACFKSIGKLVLWIINLISRLVSSYNSNKKSLSN